MADLVKPLSPRDDPTVARAVQVLRAGGARGDALGALMDFDEPAHVISTLAAVATFIGGRYYGSTGAFLEALEVWQQTGELPEPSTPNYLPRLFHDLPDMDDLSGRHRAGR